MASGRVRLPGPHLRHAAEMLKQGRNPAARVYESIGPDFFLAMAPGWLNLGLWEGAGSEEEAEDACRRLVGTLAAALPAGGVVVDVGNGLGTQDPLIAQSLHPRRLVAVNITEWQLAAGRDRLRRPRPPPWWATRSGCRWPMQPWTGSSASRRRSISAAGRHSSRSVTACCGPVGC